MPGRASCSGHHSPPPQFSWARLRPLMRLLVLPLLLGGLLPAIAQADGAAPANAANPAQPQISTAQAQQLLSVLNDDAKRQQFITTLNNLTAAQQKNAAPKVSLPDQIFSSLSSLSDKSVQQLQILRQGIVKFRDIGPWIGQVWQSHDLQMEILRILIRVVIMIVGSTILFQIVRFVLRVPHRKLDAMAQDYDRRQLRREADRMQQATRSATKEAQQNNATEEAAQDNQAPHEAPSQEVSLDEILRRQGALSRLLICLRRVPYTLANSILSGLCVLMFPLMALLIQNLDPAPDDQIAHSVWAIAWLSGVGLGIWIILLRAFLAPKQPWFRLSILHDYSSEFFYKALRHLGILVAWGYTVLIVLHNFTMPVSVSLGLEKILALAVHLMVAVMIIRARGMTHRACKQMSVHNHRIAALMQIVSRTWWVAALFFDLALWLVWAADIQGGYETILRLFVRTCVALIIMRVISILFYGILGRLARVVSEYNLNKDTQSRMLRYYPLAHKLVGIVLTILTLFALAVAWGAPIYSVFGRHTLGAEILSSIITILVALLIGVIAWEVVNLTIENHIRRLGEKDSAEQKNRMARLRTLQPMFRILLLVVLVVVIGLTVLSQLGINTGPLLASASIFGVALGFGSQKLVQDFISGIFLLMENALTVGDSVTLNGTYGVVEKLSLRSVHVRANDGSVNIFSFSALEQVTNYNRDFSRAMIAVGVSYDTDTDKAVQALLDIAKELREDPEFAPLIIDDFSLWGVTTLGESSVTVKGTYPTTTAGRWSVEWQFYRRIKKVFEERGIDIPFPTTTTINVDGGVQAKTVPGASSSSDGKDSPSPSTAS